MDNPGYSFLGNFILIVQVTCMQYKDIQFTFHDSVLNIYDFSDFYSLYCTLFNSQIKIYTSTFEKVKLITNAKWSDFGPSISVMCRWSHNYMRAHYERPAKASLKCKALGGRYVRQPLLGIRGATLTRARDSLRHLLYSACHSWV